MKKYEVVKSHEDFNEVINKGRKIGNKYFLIFCMPSSEYKTKFGIAVGKKVGNAVVRNKFKRQVRNIIDQNKLLFKKYHNYIIMVKKECLDIPYSDLEKYLIETLKKG